MTKRKGKSVSFDAMVKFFMHNYQIPNKSDLEKLMAKIDRLERLMESILDNRNIKNAYKMSPKNANPTPLTAQDTVLDVIKHFKKGVGFKEIQYKTGFGDKKLRNIIYRLNSLGRIERISRGKYIAT
ncbi:MAG: hypothetical protein PVI90_06680 [Desulfobacteraceae bacterium]|jgi:hypothetical protein